jgi:hypothetical protein
MHFGDCFKTVFAITDAAALVATWNAMIDKTKAKRLRDQALRLARSEGRASGNIEVRGQQRRIVEYQRGRLSIKYVLPRYPDAPAIKTDRPTAFTILVRFDGLKVLSIAWDDARAAVLILKPGIWERWLAA